MPSLASIHKSRFLRTPIRFKLHHKLTAPCIPKKSWTVQHGYRSKLYMGDDIDKKL